MSSKKKSAGDRLVEDLNKALVALGEELDADVSWSEQELIVLDLVRRSADDIELLEAAVVAEGAIVPGSKGQDRINPAIQELRLQRAALARLVERLQFPDVPDEEDVPVPERKKSVRHQRAAYSRWAKAKGVRS